MRGKKGNKSKQQVAKSMLLRDAAADAMPTSRGWGLGVSCALTTVATWGMEVKWDLDDSL